jgi:cytochrome c oxidase subunit 4
MDHHDLAALDRHVKAALIVFASLLLLTGFTVGAYFLHLPHRLAIALALTIAVVKGSLVCAWFMHLISEKRLIYWVLGLTVFMFFVLLLAPILGDKGGIHLT